MYEYFYYVLSVARVPFFLKTKRQFNPNLNTVIQIRKKSDLIN